MDLSRSLANYWLYIFNITRKQTHSKLETFDKDNTHEKIDIYDSKHTYKNMKTETWTSFNPQKYEWIENKGWFRV